MTTIYEVYNEEGQFQALFHDDEAAAYDFAMSNELVKDSWEVRPIIREGIGQE